jgi:hypothetical protein
MKKACFKRDFAVLTDTGKIAGKTWPLATLQEIQDFAAYPNGFTTINSSVFQILSFYGVNIIPHGIGWTVKKLA